MDVESESINKRKQIILDCIEVFDFKNALEQSTQLITKRGTLENTFRCGTKILSALTTNINKTDHLISCYMIFKQWFEYCLSYNQNLLSRNNLLYYGISYTKSLITEKVYDISLIMLDQIQDAYSFVCDMSPDADNDRYIRYMAPLSYNSSLKKDLINDEPEIAMKLYIHGVKFYLKYQSNFYILLDSIRSIEISFVKFNLVEKFYTSFFDFIKISMLCNKSVGNNSVGLKKSEPVPINKAIEDKLTKQIYLVKFYTSLYLQYVSICYNSHLSKEKATIRNEFSTIQSYFLNEDLYSSMKKADKDVKTIPRILNILDQILNYSNQYHKETRTRSKQKENNNADILKENSVLETKLENSFNEIYSEIIDKSDNSYYQAWILNYLFEILITGNSAIFNDPTVNSNFIQDSQIQFLIIVSILHAKTVQKLHTLHHQPDKMSKSVVIKPLSSFLICEKVVEQSFKISTDKSKWINSETGTKLCENLIKEHNSYIKWIHECNLITNEEMNRVYNALECQTIRLCGQFYSEDILTNYIRFQKISFEIAVDRLKFMFEINKSEKYDFNSFKSFRSICENLLLSYRLKEKFEEAFDSISIIFDFLASFNLELNELEWIVTIWCKVKRDLWKAKNKTYQKITIASYLNIKMDLIDKFLLEEIRIYNSFKSMDSSVTMNDEIYYTLEKLESLTNVNSLLKCRILIEMAQFTWTNFKDSNNKFKLSSEEYVSKAQIFLNSHQCLNMNKNKSITDLTEGLRMIEIDDNKENCDEIILSPVKTQTTPKKLNALSPSNKMEETIKKTGKQTLNRRRKLQSTKSPMMSKTNSPSLSITKQAAIQKCDCVSSKIIQFQLDLFKALNDYAKCRTKMSQVVGSLIQSRSRVKENVTTNADQVQVQSMTSSCLICPELCDENGLKMDDNFLISQLDSSLNILEKLTSDSTQTSNFVKQERSFKKQFYESADLLAQLYGFFGFLTKRIQVLNFKLELLNFEFERNLELAIVDFETLYTNVILQLMKAYLNANMCEDFVTLLLSEKVNSESLKISEIDDSNLTKKNRTVKKTTKTSSVNSISYLELENIDKNNKILISKPETLIVYHLVITHYLILKHKVDDALKIIKAKVLTSSILNGKQTAYYYEIKYYLKYLQFILSMSNVGKSETKLHDIIDNETPLSLLEECYTSSFSVARYYLQNSFEPSRALNENNNKQNDDPVFFNIGNAECYRILSESLDIMQETCKYYIEISRYRDALGYIREGLDITQLHFSNRRISLFLLHQINADLVACSLPEASSRINIAKSLIGCNEIDFKQNSLKIVNDLSRFKNFLYFNNLKTLKEIKSSEQDSDVIIDCNSLVDNLNLNQNLLNEWKILSDYCINITIENYFILCNYFKTASKNNKETSVLLKKLKDILIKSTDSKPTSLNERWHLAQYFCLNFEIDSNLSHLNMAHSLIKTNPHPTLYRRICFHLFNNENLNNKLKIEHLLETQSIALRHKACSIQIKNKRKSLIDSNQFDRITNSLLFSNFNKPNSLFDKIEKNLPPNFVVVSLILVDHTNLYVVRLEAGNEPFFHKLRYDQKYTDEFKQIISENDRSMKQSDRNKFWATRSSLNNRLSVFTEEIEKNVLSYAKSLLLGSFKEFNLEKFIERMKTDLSLNLVNKSQQSLIKIIVLGVEHLDIKEMKEAFKTEFESSKAEAISYYLFERKPKLTGLKRKHVCLLVDKHLHQIPWESLPSAKKQAITRMPSIHFLLSHLIVNKLSINKEKAFYIVDPGGDLVYTKQKFQPFFEKKKSWKGLVGIAPDETQFKTALTEYELFIYTGHGSGSQYYPSDEVQKLRIQACSILMGCSSGNQYVLGDFEPYGTVLAYIIAGCPCIVGNLWDVTDRDIDRLTEDFLDSWLKDKDESSKSTDNESVICMCLNKARNGCKMTFLNGSAPIVYGLPINLNEKN